MANVADFQAAKDTLLAGVADIAGDIQALKDLLAAAGSGGLSAADTAAALDICNSMAAAVTGLAAENPPPVV